MNVFYKHFHCWKIRVPWYYMGDYTVYHGSERKCIAFTLFGHAIRIYT